MLLLYEYQDLACWMWSQELQHDTLTRLTELNECRVLSQLEQDT